MLAFEIREPTYVVALPVVRDLERVDLVDGRLVVQGVGGKVELLSRARVEDVHSQHAEDATLSPRPEQREHFLLFLRWDHGQRHWEGTLQGPTLPGWARVDDLIHDRVRKENRLRRLQFHVNIESVPPASLHPFVPNSHRGDVPVVCRPCCQRHRRTISTQPGVGIRSMHHDSVAPNWQGPDHVERGWPLPAGLSELKPNEITRRGLEGPIFPVQHVFTA
mmetsp:Transcript_53108/g.124325  ORF Transcript_53108/g.124325 Transcript_53108/m.124325 type:complete len:220 (+) Transcript_53108:344-1003(+)